MKKNILKEESYAFALRVVNLALKLQNERREFVLSRQFLKSGTSIGANVEEGQQAESRADFIHKFSIANKEATETHFWLRILRDSRLIESTAATSCLADCEEIQRLLVASIKTSKERKG